MVTTGIAVVLLKLRLNIDTEHYPLYLQWINKNENFFKKYPHYFYY